MPSIERRWKQYKFYWIETAWKYMTYDNFFESTRDVYIIHILFQIIYNCMDHFLALFLIIYFWQLSIFSRWCNIIYPLFLHLFKLDDVIKLDQKCGFKRLNYVDLLTKPYPFEKFYVRFGCVLNDSPLIVLKRYFQNSKRKWYTHK